MQISTALIFSGFLPKGHGFNRALSENNPKKKSLIRRINYWTILFIILPLSIFSQQTIIDLKTDNLPLSEVISQLEKNYDYLFSYKESDIKNIIVAKDIPPIELNDFLNNILQNTGLEHEIINGNYIILKKQKTASDNISENNKKESKNSYNICGTVVDSTMNNPLPYASIYLKKSHRGNYTAVNGNFSFGVDPNENDTIVVSYVGYSDKFFPVNFFSQSPCPTIQLNYFQFSQDFIVVTDYITDGIDLTDNGAATVLRTDRIGALPGQAEPDIFQTIQFLPGINCPNGEASNMYVRGGAADQNLILWEDIPIYHASHYFGMISAFNPYIIDKIKVYRGGFGAEYGGRASSVINLQSSDHNLKRSEFGAGVNFINGYTQGKIATPNKKAAFVYSLRRSISELWRSPTFENITQRNQQGIIQGNFDFNNLPKGVRINDDFYFLDSHIKASAHISENDDLAASFFYGNNDFDNGVLDLQKKEKQIDILDLKSNGVSIAWDHQWSANFSSKILGVNTLYDYDYNYEIDQLDTPASIDRFGNKSNRVNERQIHFSNHLKTANNYEIKLGYQYTNYDVKYQIRHESNMAILANERADVVSDINAFYIAFNSPEKNKFGVGTGLRYSGFEKIKKQYLAPRLRVWYNMNDHISWQGNIGRYYQFTGQLVQFRGDFLGIDTPIWVLADDRQVPVIDATQYQLGLVFHKKAWVVDVQAYVKETNGLSSLATAFNAGPAQIRAGSSAAKGIDILIKKRWDRIWAWACYSLSETTYKFPSFIFPEFAAPFDQRHVLNLAVQWEKGNFELALGFNAYSGTPYSIMTDFKYETGNMGNQLVVPIYDGYNDHHLAVQHHLDASVLYKFKTKKNNKFRGVIGLSLFNIYNQENIYDREYFVRKNQSQMEQIDVNDNSGLGFTPNAVVRVEW